MTREAADPVRSDSRSDVAFSRWASAEDFSAGRFESTAVSENSVALASPRRAVTYTDPYGDGTAATYEVGTWTSPEVTPGFGYTELVASWNAETPTGTWIEVCVSGTTDDGVRFGEYVLGRWADDTAAIHRTSVPGQRDDLATVRADTLVACPGRSLSTWQLTVSLYRRVGSTATPRLSLIGAMASRLSERHPNEPVSQYGGSAGFELDVPAYSQEVHVGEYPQYNGGGEAWCSPTCTAMVLAYWQRDTGDPAYGPAPADYAWVDPSYADPQVDYAAARTYDWDYDGTGNWSFNTAYAGRYRLESFVTRLRSLTEAEQFVRAGLPLVVSVSFTKSQLSGAGYDTQGHLLVVVGFTESGDVIVNDPASHLIASNDEVRTVYARSEFESVWLAGSGGIAYVTHPPSSPLPTTATPHQLNW